MRSMWLLVLYCAAAVSNVAAQTPAEVGGGQQPPLVVLRGRVVSAKLVDVTASGLTLAVELKLELLNQGSRPVILLLANKPSVQGVDMAGTPEDVSAGEVWVRSYMGDAVDRSPQWAALRKRLDVATPPAGQVLLLKPGESWPLETSWHLAIPTERGVSSYWPRRESWENISKAPAAWLDVYLQVWSSNLEPSKNDRSEMKFGRKLQRRWNAFGQLLLDDIISEPLKLDLEALRM